MANFSLVVNSKFNPFSFERYIQPYQIYGQAYREVEDTLGELDTKASVWEEMANEQTDPYAYKMYKTYANDLEEQAGQLAREGLNASSRRNMLNMRARYSKEITPIEVAYKRRGELAAEQRKASLSNPTMFYQRNASAMSLDDFIKNPSIDYGERYSGALLAQQVGQMAANLKTALTGKGKLKSIGLSYQYEQLLQYGYTPQQIQQAITNPQEGNPVLNTIVEQALAASGMKNWASPEQLAQARAYANEGLYNAIGKTDIKNYTDSFSMQDALARRREERASQAQIERNSLAINRVPIYAAKENSNPVVADKMARLSRYVVVGNDGKVHLTPAAVIAFNFERGQVNRLAEMDNPYRNAEPQRFPLYYTLKDLGFANLDTNNLAQLDLAASKLHDYTVTNSVSSDATRYSAWQYRLPTTENAQKNIKLSIQVAGRGGDNELQEVKWDNKTKSYVPTGETLSFEDLMSTDYTVYDRQLSKVDENSPAQRTTLITNKNGETKRYMYPAGISPTNEDGIIEALGAMSSIQSDLDREDLSKNDRARLTQAYRNYANLLYNAESQLDLYNETSSQQFGPQGM